MRKRTISSPVAQVLVILFLIPAAPSAFAAIAGSGPPAVPWSSSAAGGPDRRPPVSISNIVLVTYAASAEQARSAAALVKSVRRFGGDESACGFKIVRVGAVEFSDAVFNDPHVEILPLDPAAAFLDYPLAVKAFAAALAEDAVKDSAGTLIWMDPGVLVLSGFSALRLDGDFDAAFRPVTLHNGIGLEPGAPPDAYWEPIYRVTGLSGRRLPRFRTIVDEIDIQPYFNCEVYALDPRRGICREWAALLTDLLRDETYQRTACSEFRRRLFLHQAVLSAVAVSRIRPERLKPLPLSSGYPFSQHVRLPAARRLSFLNDVSVVIFDETWSRDPQWMSRVPVLEPLKSGLLEIWREYLGR